LAAQVMESIPDKYEKTMLVLCFLFNIPQSIEEVEHIEQKYDISGK